MPSELEGTVCTLPHGLEGSVRKHSFQPRPRELDAIPENAQVVPDCAWDAQPEGSDAEAGVLSQSQHQVMQQKVLALIEGIFIGGRSRGADSVSQLHVETRLELDLIAQILVGKAFADPHYTEACAMLACTLQTYLPAVPRAPTRQGKKVEKFMHALLDVFQTVFEDIFLNPRLQSQNTVPYMDKQEAEEVRSRELTTLYFAAHLYRWGLLKEKVMSQMVHDLIDAGASDVAKELLQVVGIVLNKVGHGTPGQAPAL